MFTNFVGIEILTNLTVLLPRAFSDKMNLGSPLQTQSYISKQSEDPWKNPHCWQTIQLSIVWQDIPAGKQCEVGVVKFFKVPLWERFSIDSG